VPADVTAVTAHSLDKCFAVAAPFSLTVYMLVLGVANGGPSFYSQARRDHKHRSSLWVPILAFTKSANPHGHQFDHSLNFATGRGSVASRSPGTDPCSRWGFCSFTLGADALAPALRVHHSLGAVMGTA
jgi:hypothetical protein